MKRVLFRAPVLTQSGYGVHSRQVLRWLKVLEDKGKIALQVQVLPWGTTSWFVNPEEKNGLIGYAMSRTGPSRPPYDWTFQLQLPNEWDPRLGVFNVGMTAGVETTLCNVEWTMACNHMSRIVVPSVHSKKTLVDSGKITTRIDVVPESFSDECSSESLGRLDLPLSDDDFAVLIHGQITGNTAATDRKNLFNLVKWLCETFGNNDKFVIVLKTNMSKNTEIDRMITTNLLEKLVNEVRRGKSPRLVLVHGDMSDSENAALYRHPSIKALVTLTRGEGFGLPILEAAASGMPVIATGWSAHCEYLNDFYTKIEHELIDVPSSKIDGKIFVKGCKWADAVEGDFKKKMKSFVLDKDVRETAERTALQLRDQLRESHSWGTVSRMYSDLFEDKLS